MKHTLNFEEFFRTAYIDKTEQEEWDYPWTDICCIFFEGKCYIHQYHDIPHFWYTLIGNEEVKHETMKDAAAYLYKNFYLDEIAPQ